MSRKRFGHIEEPKEKRLRINGKGTKPGKKVKIQDKGLSYDEAIKKALEKK